MPKRLAFPVLLVIAAVLIGAGVYLYLNPALVENIRNSMRQTTVIEDPAEIDKMVIGFVGSPFVDDYNMLRVPGYVDNNSDSDIKSATLEIQLIDEDGNKKELVEYIMEDIGARSRETYDVNAGTVPADRTATIRIVQLEVYK